MKKLFKEIICICLTLLIMFCPSFVVIQAHEGFTTEEITQGLEFLDIMDEQLDTSEAQQDGTYILDSNHAPLVTIASLSFFSPRFQVQIDEKLSPYLQDLDDLYKRHFSTNSLQAFKDLPYTYTSYLDDSIEISDKFLKDMQYPSGREFFENIAQIFQLQKNIDQKMKETSTEIITSMRTLKERFPDSSQEMRESMYREITQKVDNAISILEQQIIEDAREYLGMLENGPDTLYRLLGVEPQAESSEIKSAYKKLALIYHPDTTKLDPEQAEEHFKKINEAHETLINPEKRAQYDKSIEALTQRSNIPSERLHYREVVMNERIQTIRRFRSTFVDAVKKAGVIGLVVTAIAFLGSGESEAATSEVETENIFSLFVSLTEDEITSYREYIQSERQVLLDLQNAIDTSTPIF